MLFVNINTISLSQLQGRARRGACQFLREHLAGCQHTSGQQEGHKRNENILTFQLIS